MRFLDWMWRHAAYLNIGALLAVVLWIMWVVSLSAGSAWTDSSSVQRLHVCLCEISRRGVGSEHHV